MGIRDRVLGKPLATSDEHGEHIGVSAGIPIFGLDALTSAAYGPEAAMALLVPLGMTAGLPYIMPIITAILILLVIVFFSYRQTITAYPTGGGSYTVASENLGDRAGLLAAAALMIDYILTAAVGISAGVTALTSAVPVLLPHTLLICLVILGILAVVNLRGVKETGTAFIIPTFLFIRNPGRADCGRRLQDGFKWIPSGSDGARSRLRMRRRGNIVGLAFGWLIVKAFSSGCAAMTGGGSGGRTG